MSDFGIPASIVAKYLDEHGIVVEKTGPYNLLFLFSIGIDKTKALSLLRYIPEVNISAIIRWRVIISGSLRTAWQTRNAS